MEFKFPEGRDLEDYAVSANGKTILALVNSKDKTALMVLKRSPITLTMKFEHAFEEHALAVVSHPEIMDQWFILSREGKDKGTWNIWSLKTTEGKVQKELIFKSTLQLRRLLISSRPFYTFKDRESPYYRLVFARKNKKGIWHIETIRTSKNDTPFAISMPKALTGKWVCPPGASRSQLDDGFDCMFHYTTISEPKGALPLSFHPRGGSLSYESSGCARNANYGDSWYAKKITDCPTPTFYHPGGVITWSWTKGQPGITLENHPRKKKGTPVFESEPFIMPPIFLPDGRSVAGVVTSQSNTILKILPYDDPYGAIFNLWRFDVPEKALDQLVTIGGVLLPAMSPGSHSRPANFFHDVYDYINYTGEGSLPPIVLTDPFWYTASIAIEVGFTYMEKYGAIPSYRNFLTTSIAYLKAIKKRSAVQERWFQVFMNAEEILSDNKKSISRDVKLCLAGEGKETVTTLGKMFDFSECKPRSHYTNDPLLASYWRSFQYLTKGTSHSKEDELQGQKFADSLLAGFPDLPAAALQSAKLWITSYEKWMAPSTFLGVLESDAAKRWIVKHPFRKCGIETNFAYFTRSLYPLGWGQDDEVMCQLLDRSPVENPNLGEWVRAISGSSTFDELFTKVRKDLPWKDWQKATADHYSHQKEESFYASYLSGIRTDLLVHKPVGIFQAIDENFLKVRSVLSGVGGWTHLKHTLQLVSETPSAAQGGQGGPYSMEEMLVEIPPAAVEPRPEVFSQQKKVLDLAIALTTPHVPKDEVSVLNQMREVASELDLFVQAAQAQKEGKLIDDKAGQHARDLGRFLDHKDIFFNGLLSPGYSVARGNENLNMGIVASVSKANSIHGYTGTGRPLLAYFVIEEAGKRRLVLGSTFSVYFFQREVLINDKEWQKKILPEMKYPEEYSGFVK